MRCWYVHLIVFANCLNIPTAMPKRILLILLSFVLISTSLMGQTAMPGATSVRMGVVLPLKEKTARGAKMVEFYRGLLMAVDSLKRDGLSVDVQAVHSGSTASEMDQLLFSQQLHDCDIVFGPLDAAQLPALADYCDLHGTHLVVPFSNESVQLTAHPRYYIVNAPRATIQQEAIWYIQSLFIDYNIILVECNDSNEEGKAFGELLRDVLSEQGIAVRPLNINSDDVAIQQAFNAQRKNLIILNSSNIKALNQIIPKLKKFKQAYPDYQLSLFGFPSWQTYTSQVLSDFYLLDTYVFTTFYRNPLARRSEEIDQQFTNWFHTPMASTFPRYALMGFDLGCFFLRGFSIFGNDRLAQNIQQVPARPYQHPLFFEQAGEDNGYVNTFVQLIHYTPYQSIELMTRNH